MRKLIMLRAIQMRVHRGLPSISELTAVRKRNFVDQLIENGNYAVSLSVDCTSDLLICICSVDKLVFFSSDCEMHSGRELC